MSELEGFREIRMIREAADFLGIADPFFRVHEGIAGAETLIGDRTYINFASYNYIGLNGHPHIASAAKAAIDRYGTTVSASRPVSGERPIHRELEQALARIHGCEDCVVLVGGHSTNVTVIGHLLGRNDVIVHDALIHNSIVQGATLSGARRVPFSHLDHRAADRLLGELRPRHGRALLVIEGHYSMDGDVPDLPGFIAAARRHRAWLMVDEAHALGVLGPRGFGTADHAGIDPSDVDIWMGTLSKSLVSCGGYIAGRRDLHRLSEARRARLRLLGWDGTGRSCCCARRTRDAGARARAGAPAQRQGRAFSTTRTSRRPRCRRFDRRLNRAGHHRELDPCRTACASNVPARGQRPADPIPGGTRASRPFAVFSDGSAYRRTGPRHGAGS